MNKRLWSLIGLGAASEASYVLIALAGQSLHVEGVGNWSLLAILGLYGFAVVAYLAALAIVRRLERDVHRSYRVLAVVIGAGVLFRLTLLPTDPVAEIDIYRYLWDGRATAAGVNPFRYSPAQVLAVDASQPVPQDLAKLVAVRDGSPEYREILRRVHFGHLPTIYPPTSQAVFVLATWTTPSASSIFWRMVWFKVWFVAFDLATLAIVIYLLWCVGKPLSWSLVYAWCPLLIKEIANSGHLDAVALFFCTAAIASTVRLCPFGDCQPSAPSKRRRHLPLAVGLAGGLWALAIGAKLYPLVLLPLYLATVARRTGWRLALLAAAVVSTASLAVMWPMIPKHQLTELPAFRFSSQDSDLPPLPPPVIDVDPRDPSESLRTFLSEWEMNDFIFLLLMENTRSMEGLPANEVAWFSVVPERWRAPARRWAGRVTGVEPSRTPFFLSRILSTGVFLPWALLLAWRAAGAERVESLLSAGFLTLAWFWLILPTGNPWYWTWVIPLLPFARSRIWLAGSGLVFLYYLRFWLVFHFPTPPVCGTPYHGALFFDYVVTWIEFAPWLLLLGCSAAMRRWNRAGGVVGQA